MKQCVTTVLPVAKPADCLTPICKSPASEHYIPEVVEMHFVPAATASVVQAAAADWVASSVAYIMQC